ncbi:MAG: methyltransferase, partial [Nitrospirae bacterium]
MAELEEIILSEIKKHGPITFERFMELALYHPQYGYYMRQEVPFGPEGDFYTSAHLPLFGESLSLQVEEVLEKTNWQKISIIEIGPGMGYTASGILNQLALSDLIDRVEYILVEPNPYLQAQQKELLKDFLNFCRWQRIDEISPVNGIIIANEVVDALAVHIIEFLNGQFQEIYVTEKNGKLLETLGPLSSQALKEYIKKYRVPPIENYRTEVNLRARELLLQLASILNKGIILLIDYGYSAEEYYFPERNRGTLLCYHHHRTDEAVLEAPGQ